MTAESQILGSHLNLSRSNAIITYKPSITTLFLAIIVMLTGLAVVYVADLNRRVFIELQEAQSYQNQLRSDWGKLLLEQSTWANQARLQNLASEHLAMVAPASNEIVMIAGG